MTWLAGQVDYLLFVTGLCYISAGTAALLVRLQSDRSQSWSMLFASLTALGGAAWLQLLGLLAGDPSWLLVMRSGVRFIGWFGLLEFGRRVFRSHGGRVLPIWVTLAPALAAAGMTIFGLNAFNTATHALVAVPGAGLCLIGFWRLRQVSVVPSAHALRPVGIGLLANAVASTAVYASGAVSSSGATLLGVPSPVFQVGSSLLAAAGLLVYSCLSIRERTGTEDTFALVRSLSIIPILTLIAAGGWYATGLAGTAADQVERQGLIRRAATAAAAIEVDKLRTLTGTSTDLSNADFTDVRDELDRIRLANPDLGYVYLMRSTGAGRIIFMADSGQQPSVPGEVYAEASTVLKRVFATSQPASEGPLKDRWGTWVSAFVPVRSPTTGAFLGVLGTDVDAATWLRGTSDARLTGMVLTGATCLLVLFFFGLAMLADYSKSQLGASEGRMRTVLETAPEGIMLVDPESGRVLEANPCAAAFFGIPRADVESSAIDGLLRDPEGETTPLERLLDGKPQEFETNTGTARIVEVTCTPLQLVEGESVLVFLRDVTARKAAEDELHERIALENLVRAVSSRFIAAEPGDVRRLIEQALATFGTFFGVQRAYLFAFSDDLSVMSNTFEWCAEGTPCLKASQEDQPTAEYGWLMDRMKHNEFVHVPRFASMPATAISERELFTARGVTSALLVPMSSGWRVSGFLGFDSIGQEREWSGERIALISVLADIFANAMRRASSEEELAKLSLAVTQSPAATVITDETGVIEYVNPRFRELSGYSSEELIGQNLRLLKSGITKPEAYTAMWSTISSGRQWRGEIINRRKDRSLYWVQESISPVRDAMGRTYYVGVQEDISAIKEAEEALSMAAEAANAANRAKSDFLATMSHEIRTPMNAIIGMAELLEETPLDDEQTRYVRIFRSAGESLLTLINDVLDLSKIEAGRFELDVREFDVEKLVEDTAEVLAVRARDKGIELLASVGTDVPSHVVGDPDRLRQVIVNLVGNAVKFTEAGHVLIGVTTADGSTPEAPRLRFSVTDTGIGIPAEKLMTVFSAFTQADSSTTRKYGGTGLGLTISRHLANLMGGDISVTSTVGRGSTFSLEATFGPAEGVVDSDALSGLSGIRALVVDDTEANRIIERQYLECAGATVDEAVGGTEALEMFRDLRRAYDIVLLDLRMPEMSGIQLAARIRAELGSRTPAMIVVSSDSRAGDAQRAREAGAHALLTKPVRRRDLVTAVRAAIDSGERRRVPEAAGAESAAPPTGATTEDAAPMRILLVEDTEDNRMLVLAYLRNTPHEVVIAENGQLAVDAYRDATTPFDLILMDMQMPVMDGYEATSEIRKIEAAESRERVRIVALTAFALPQEAKTAIDAGCDEYLTKPIKKATLLEAVGRSTEVAHG
ncbi:MAG: response regulator [Coriobacteriia bacterium]|nr:response regulator [Coriobacteriia bacterium]